MRTIESENAKAVKNGAKIVEGGKFTGIVRQLELNTLHDGDIVEIPTNYVVLEQKMRGSEQTAQYINVNVTRGGKTLVVPFYPSSLWKSRQIYDEKTQELGDWKRANGTVVDLVQEYDDVDDAIKAVAAKGKFTVALTSITCLRFQEEPGGKFQKTNIGTYNWAA